RFSSADSELSPGSSNRKRPTGSGAGVDSSSKSARLLRQGDGEFQYLLTVLALDVDLHGRGIDVDVLTDHFQQLTAQQRQIVRAAISGVALLLHDDAQALLGDVRGRGRPAKQCK